MMDDPDELDRLAGELDRRAEELGEQFGGVRRHADALRWDGEAAPRFRNELAGDHREVGQACDELRAAARDLRRTAEEMRERRRQEEAAMRTA